MTYTVYQRTTADDRVEFIYVSQGIGGPDGRWMTVYRSLSGGEHRVKALPLRNQKDEAQVDLDEYAYKKFWSPARAYDKCGFPHQMTWEEAQNYGRR
jgi:hypothetical protein